MNVGAVGATGGSAANQLAAEADVVLAVGTRLADFTTASKTAFHPGATFIGLNVSPLDAHKLFALPLVGDAKRGLESLLSALDYAGTADSYHQKITELKQKWDGTVDEILTVDDPKDLAQGAGDRDGQPGRGRGRHGGLRGRAVCPATCTSSGALPATRAPITWSTATRVWVTRFRQGSASNSPNRSAR